MINHILDISKSSKFDFTDYACPNDPLKRKFADWVHYYRLKFAISKAIKPSTILEIGVRYGYSAYSFLSACPNAKYTGIDNNSDTYGGVKKSIEWAKTNLSNFNVDFILEDSQQIYELPLFKYDLFHIDGQQDGSGTYKDLELAFHYSEWVLLDGYHWSSQNHLEANEFLLRHKELIEYSINIPSYAGELLIKIKKNLNRPRYKFRKKKTSQSSNDLIKTYDAEYYLNDCGGHQSFKDCGVERLDDSRILSILALTKLAPIGEAIDIGCGRGEVCFHLAKTGFNVHGIDYSKTAIDIARNAGLEKQKKYSKRLSYECIDVNLFEFKKNYSLVVCTDVIEHLSDSEVDKLYIKISEKLSDDGLFILHTFPNSWYYDYFYNKKKRIVEKYGGFLSSEPRSMYEKIMHINEQNPASMRKQLSKNFNYVKFWFGSSDDLLGSLKVDVSFKELCKYPSLYAICSHSEIDMSKLHDFGSSRLFFAEDVKGKIDICISECPIVISADEQFTVKTSIWNKSSYSLNSFNKYPINISYHWYKDGTCIESNGIRTPFHFPILSGVEETLEIYCKAPKVIGSCDLLVTLVQEHHAWFCQDGFEVFDKTVMTIL
ncbi:MAG: methyltransferase domain-containing protein [Firmicutes bacterium]|nr:methyltransferase domain-containing protein [Bacillota bacterium]